MERASVAYVVCLVSVIRDRRNLLASDLRQVVNGASKEPTERGRGTGKKAKLEGWRRGEDEERKSRHSLF